MNVRAPHPIGTTRAAEGLLRRAFTVAEVERMVEVGLIAEDERLELIGGELVPMAPKGIRHDVLKAALLRDWYTRSPPGLQIVPETTVRLSVDTFLEPDVIVFRDPVRLSGITGRDILLAVEIADSSVAYDMGRKAAIYAEFGIPELWVIDARKLATHVHLAPAPSGYGEIDIHAPEAILVPAGAPELTLHLAGLDLAE